MWIFALVYCELVFGGVGGDGMVLFEWVVFVVVVWWYWKWWKCSSGSGGLMVVLTAFIQVAFLIVVGLL